MTEQAAEPVRRLRVQHVFVQPMLLWDDGTELTEGPQVMPKVLPASEVAAYIESLPEVLAEIEARPENENLTVVPAEHTHEEGSL